MNLEKGIASSKHINLKHLGYLRNPPFPEGGNGDVTSEWLTNGISPESPITFEC